MFGIDDALIWGPLVGAALGGLTRKKNPLEGALMGGALGLGGAALAPSMGGLLAAEGAAGAGTAAGALASGAGAAGGGLLGAGAGTGAAAGSALPGIFSQAAAPVADAVVMPTAMGSLAADGLGGIAPSGFGVEAEGLSFAGMTDKLKALKPWGDAASTGMQVAKSMERPPPEQIMPSPTMQYAGGSEALNGLLGQMDQQRTQQMQADEMRRKMRRQLLGV